MESITEAILRLLKAGKTSKQLKAMGYNENTIKSTRQKNGFCKSNKRELVFMRIKRLGDKTQTYYTNELDYGIQELTYNFDDCKTEYQLEGKESFTYEKRGNITIQRVRRMDNIHKVNSSTVGDFK